jgi:hypothetical protein
MAASPWQDIYIAQPANGAVVWVRRLLSEIPYLATWSLAGQNFTLANGMVIGVQWVSKWRPQ